MGRGTTQVWLTPFGFLPLLLLQHNYLPVSKLPSATKLPYNVPPTNNSCAHLKTSEWAKCTSQHNCKDNQRLSIPFTNYGRCWLLVFLHPSSWPRACMLKMEGKLNQAARATARLVQDAQTEVYDNSDKEVIRAVIGSFHTPANWPSGLSLFATFL